MASSLLEKLLAAAGLRLRVAAGAWLPEVTLQPGANVTITELGNVVTIASSLAASTRVRANAAAYVSGDVTFLNGTNVTIAEDSGAKTLTINASGGSALPSPYTATVDGDGGLVVTGPDVNATAEPPPDILFKGRKNIDLTDDKRGGHFTVKGGDNDNTGGSSAGFGMVEGGDGAIPGDGVVRGGATTVEGGTAGRAILQGRNGYGGDYLDGRRADAHASLTNVIGGDAVIYGGRGKGTGYGGSIIGEAGNPGAGGTLGGPVSFTGGEGPFGGEVKYKGGKSTATDVPGGRAFVEGGEAEEGFGGTGVVRGGQGTQQGGPGLLSGGDVVHGHEYSYGGDAIIRVGYNYENNRLPMWLGTVRLQMSDGTAHGLADAEGAGGDDASVLYVGEHTSTDDAFFNVLGDRVTIPFNSKVTVVSKHDFVADAGSYAGVIMRRSTWKRGASGAPTLVGTVKNLTEADEESSCFVQHNVALISGSTYRLVVEAAGPVMGADNMNWIHQIEVVPMVFS